MFSPASVSLSVCLPISIFSDMGPLQSAKIWMMAPGISHNCKIGPFRRSVLSEHTSIVKQTRSSADADIPARQFGRFAFQVNNKTEKNKKCN